MGELFRWDDYRWIHRAKGNNLFSACQRWHKIILDFVLPLA
jgi:hypothetical protein